MRLNLEALNKLRPELRERIQEQARRDDEAEVATRRRRDCARGPTPAAVRPQLAPSLAGRRPRKPTASRGGGGSGKDRYFANYVLHCPQPYDWDNAAGSIKAIQDALVAEGWLPDDGWDVLDGVCWCEKCRKGEERVEVTLVKIA